MDVGHPVVVLCSEIRLQRTAHAHAIIKGDRLTVVRLIHESHARRELVQRAGPSIVRAIGGEARLRLHHIAF